MPNKKHSISKLMLHRRGRKLSITDDVKIIAALPKDVPDRVWAEVFQKEESDLIVFDIREDILEAAIDICYQNYLKHQTTIFTVHCVAQAYLRLINWQFYRHDPGEDPTAKPECYIPNRRQSWIPDEMPTVSPKDSWNQQDMVVVEQDFDKSRQKLPKPPSSIEFPRVDYIPPIYWFPGKILLKMHAKPGFTESSGLEVSQGSGENELSYSDENIGDDSETVQNIVTYSTDEASKLTGMDSAFSDEQTGTQAVESIDGSLHGAGDSKVRIRTHSHKTRKVAAKKSHSSKIVIRSSKALPPLNMAEAKSAISNNISDCRLRGLRVGTLYTVTSEVLNTPPGHPPAKRQ